MVGCRLELGESKTKDEVADVRVLDEFRTARVADPPAMRSMSKMQRINCSTKEPRPPTLFHVDEVPAMGKTISNQCARQRGKGGGLNVEEPAQLR